MALGALPSTTVGYERNVAWCGRHLAADDEQGLIDELLDGQPDAHVGTVRSALSIPGKAAAHIGWAFDPESDEAENIVLTPGPDAASGTVSCASLSPAALVDLRYQRQESGPRGVRNRSEHVRGTVPGAPAAPGRQGALLPRGTR